MRTTDLLTEPERQLLRTGIKRDRKTYWQGLKSDLKKDLLEMKKRKWVSQLLEDLALLAVSDMQIYLEQDQLNLINSRLASPDAVFKEIQRRASDERATERHLQPGEEEILEKLRKNRGTYWILRVLNEPGADMAPEKLLNAATIRAKGTARIKKTDLELLERPEIGAVVRDRRGWLKITRKGLRLLMNFLVTMHSSSSSDHIDWSKLPLSELEKDSGHLTAEEEFHEKQSPSQSTP